MHTGFCCRNLMERDHLEKQGLVWRKILEWILTLRLLMSYIYGAPSKARNANVVYIWTYVWQR